jgi:hypothetical protein
VTQQVADGHAHRGVAGQRDPVIIRHSAGSAARVFKIFSS